MTKEEWKKQHKVHRYHVKNIAKLKKSKSRSKAESTLLQTIENSIDAFSVETCYAFAFKKGEEQILLQEVRSSGVAQFEIEVLRVRGRLVYQGFEGEVPV